MVSVKPKLDKLYAEYIRPLPPEDQLWLLAEIARNLALNPQLGKPRERSLLELEGVGAEIWQGVDAQSYVRSLREEWDHRP